MKCGNLGKSINVHDIRETFYINHRKSLVINGQIAYTGGLNIGNEYVGFFDAFGDWVDLHVRLVGSAVKSMVVIFLKDWLFLTNQKIHHNHKNSFLPINNKKKVKLNNICQFINETPGIRNSQTQNLFLHLINQAKKRIYITTPLFYIHSQLEKSLCNAALSGINVSIFLPDLNFVYINDHLRQLYYNNLLKAGVKIYE